MGIDRNSHVIFEYVLRDDAGELLEASEVSKPPSYIHGYQMLLPGLEKEMLNHDKDDKFTVVVAPKYGYGIHDDSLIVTIPRSEIPDGVDVNIGQSFDAVNDHDHKIKLRVKGIDDKLITLDANHPLAGVELHYSITIKDVRPATEDELMDASAELMGTDIDKGSVGQA